jgi:hypothetical protein
MSSRLVTTRDKSKVERKFVCVHNCKFDGYCLCPARESMQSESVAATNLDVHCYRLHVIVGAIRLRWPHPRVDHLLGTHVNFVMAWLLSGEDARTLAQAMEISGTNLCYRSIVSSDH